MFCHNKPLFPARSEGLGRLAHSFYITILLVLTQVSRISVLESLEAYKTEFYACFCSQVSAILTSLVIHMTQ